MESFRYRYIYQVRVADINYGRRVANSAVLNIFQDARIGYLAELGPFSELDLGGCGIILPEAHVYFREEMFLGDLLEVGVRCSVLKRSSFELEYRVERGGTVTAEGQTPVICFNYQTHKLCRMPAEFRQSLCGFEQL